MADKAISQLNPATAVTALDLFVLEQSGEAKKLTGQILENWLLSYADGHGGVQSFVKIGSSGTNPVIDVWRMTYSDETYTDIPVTNGVKGDQGDQTYVWIKYAAHYPTSDADMSPSPDDWIGIYSGTSSTAPVHYTDYTWYEFKGEKGDTGEAATIVAQTVGYQQSDSGSVVPEGSWTTTVPAPVQGKFLWTRMQLQFNTGSTITSYSVSRYGMDGSGSVVSVNNVSPDLSGNVQLVANDIQAADNQSIQTHLSDAETEINGLKTSLSTVEDELHLNAKVVDASGGGDYTSLTHALYSTTSDLVIKAGTYDIVAEYKAEFGNNIFSVISDSYTSIGMFRYGLYVDNRKLTFESGAQVNCDLTGLLTVDGTHRFSPFNMGSNAIIDGLKCYAVNTYYLIHDDYGDVNEYYTNIIENCILYGTIVNANIIGGGTRNHGTNIVRNCTLDNGNSATETMRYHNYNSATASPTVIVENCFANGTIGARYYGSQSSPHMRFIAINNQCVDVVKRAEGSATVDNVDLFVTNGSAPHYDNIDGWQVWRFPSGLAICVAAKDGEFNFAANTTTTKTFNFPITFAQTASPVVQATVNTTIPDKLHITTSGVTHTTFTLTGVSSFVADQGPRLNIIVYGFWK